MADTLFSFLYRSVCKQISDPESSHWLPAQLEKLGLPLRHNAPDTIPLREGVASQSIQSIVLAQWQLLLEADLGPKSEILDEFAYVISPEKPYPELTVKNLAADGLQNVKLLASADVWSGPDGYRTTITARGPAYDTLPRLNLTGEFTVQLTVWAAEKDDLSRPTPRRLPLRWMKWPVETIAWYGSFSIDAVTDVCADIQAQIGVDGADESRIPRFTVEKITIRGASQGDIPDLRLDPDRLVVETDFSGIGPILAEQTKAAFACPDAQKYLINSINAAVNAAGLRQKMSGEATGFLRQTLDRQLGAVSPGRLPAPAGPRAPNPADQYLFDRARFALTDKGGAFYLPDVVKNSRRPVLEPYVVPSLSLGDFTVGGITFAHITLQPVVLAGLSGLRPDPGNLVWEKGGVVSATIALDLQIRAEFCFWIEDLQTNGTLEIALNSRAARVRARFGGGEADALTLTFCELSLSAEPRDVRVAVHMQSIFLEMINAFFNGDDMKRTLVTELNRQIAANRDALGASATKKLRELIKSNLK